MTIISLRQLPFTLPPMRYFYRFIYFNAYYHAGK